MKVKDGCCGVISVNIHELVSKKGQLVSKKGKNCSLTVKQFRKYFQCFCLAEALLAEAEVEKAPSAQKGLPRGGVHPPVDRILDTRL